MKKTDKKPAKPPLSSLLRAPHGKVMERLMDYLRKNG
jgi:hypothetical protein